MAWESALGSVIEVAISIVGFSGIVAAVGRRGAGHWSPLDQLRLRILLTAGGAALAFAFLPFTMIDELDETLVWRVCSGLWVVYMFGISLYRIREASRMGMIKTVGYHSPSFLISQFVVIVMIVANTLWFALSSLYVLAVLWNITLAFMTFVTLLLESWQDPPDPSPPPA
jgi:hypothetical protein